MGYTNSKLVDYKMISPNKSAGRNHVLDTITIHCMAGNLTVETCGNIFKNPKAQASSNYGVDSKGRIGLYVEEKDRSWATSSSVNDNRAVTIEVANDGGAPDWHASDAAVKATIKLVADICKRNGIKKLVWSTNKANRINHVNGCNMTVHRDYANKACPGNYLYSKMGYIADEVNKLLNVKEQKKPAEKPATAKKEDTKKAAAAKKTTTSKAKNVKDYKAKVTAKGDLNVRKEPKADAKIVKVIKYNEVYTITEEKNGFGKLQSGIGWVSLNWIKKV